MRNMRKAEKEGLKLVEKRPGLDLSASDLYQLLEIYKENGEDLSAAYYALTTAYCAGLAIAARNYPLQAKKKKQRDYKPAREITLRVITEAGTPDTIRGAYWPESPEDPEERYTILINPNMTEEIQAEAFLHECLHIWHKDHQEETKDADQIETERHAEAQRILQSMAEAEA